jgi:hypothetical protein
VDITSAFKLLTQANKLSHAPKFSRIVTETENANAHALPYSRSQPRAIEYVVDEPRRSTQRVRSVSRRRVSEAEARSPRGSYVDERTRRSVSRVRY